MRVVIDAQKPYAYGVHGRTRTLRRPQAAFRADEGHNVVYPVKYGAALVILINLKLLAGELVKVNTGIFVPHNFDLMRAGTDTAQNEQFPV
jgi:hypothetical protein